MIERSRRFFALEVKLRVLAYREGGGYDVEL